MSAYIHMQNLTQTNARLNIWNKNLYEYSNIVDSASAEYCSTFTCPCVRVCVTGVTSHLFTFITCVRPCKPYIFWKLMTATIHWPLGDHLVTTWWPLGDHLGTTWWPLGDHLVTRPLGDHLVLANSALKNFSLIFTLLSFSSIKGLQVSVMKYAESAQFTLSSYIYIALYCTDTILVSHWYC